MKTRDMIIIAVVAIGLVVIYLMTRSSSTTDTAAPTTAAPQAPKDPRENLSNLLKGTLVRTEHFTVTSPSSSPSPTADLRDITRNVKAEWPVLSELVKSITGKPAPLCIDIPSTIRTDEDSRVKGTSTNIMSTNIAYAIKEALNISMIKNNFYDIAAIFFQMVKIMSGSYPFPITPTYDEKGLLSTISVYSTREGQWTIELLKNILTHINMSVPTPKDLGNDPDLISFMDKAVPFCKEYIKSWSTLSSEQLSNTIFDVNTFGKISCCLLTSKMSETPVPQFICTSSLR